MDTTIEDIKYNNKISVEYKTFIEFVNHLGFFKARCCNGTHTIYKNDKGKTVPIPYQKGTMKIGTLSRILKEIGCTRKDLAIYINFNKKSKNNKKIK